MPCGHILHSKCAKGWLKVNRRCPLCRLDLEDHFQQLQQMQATEQPPVEKGLLSWSSNISIPPLTNQPRPSTQKTYPISFKAKNILALNRISAQGGTQISHSFWTCSASNWGPAFWADLCSSPSAPSLSATLSRYSLLWSFLWCPSRLFGWGWQSLALRCIWTRCSFFHLCLQLRSICTPGLVFVVVRYLEGLWSEATCFCWCSEKPKTSLYIFSYCLNLSFSALPVPHFCEPTDSCLISIFHPVIFITPFFSTWGCRNDSLFPIVLWTSAFPLW